MTPLTDVMLVLLITFLLTANAFQTTDLSVPLPQVMTRRELPTDVEIVSVDLQGALSSPLMSEGFSMEQLRGKSQHRILALAVDRSLPYGRLFPILESAEQAGWAQIVILTEEEL